MSTFDPTTATVTGTLTLAAPNGDVIVHDGSPDPNFGGYGFKLAYAAVPRTQGPPSDASYVNDTWALGMNVGAPGLKADPNKQYVALHWESKTYAGPTDPASPLSRFGLDVIDTSGVTHRPIGWAGRHDGSASTLTLQAGIIAFQDYAARQKVVFDFDQSKSIIVYDGIGLVFAKNNTPVASQLNSAGTASYPLPYLDANDNILVSRPLTGAAGGGPVTFSNPATGGTTVLQATAPNASAATVVLTCGSGAAAKSASYGIDSAGNLVFRQVSAGGATLFDFNSFVNWRDKSAGYAKRMVVGPTSAQFHVPVRAPSYTVQTLPSAAGAGAGALVFVTDAASGPTFACSDGTKWRVVAALGDIVA